MASASKPGKGHVTVASILGSYRYFVGLVLASLCAVPACSNLIGLNGYSVGGEGGGEPEGRARNDAGRAGAALGGDSSGGGAAGDTTIGDAGNDGVLNGGSTGHAGSGGSAGNGETAGAANSCPDSCDDGNECTDDACVSAKCVHQPVAVGTDCGTGQSCDADAICVRCRDTAPGTGRDVGCPASAPVCVGTGSDAVCGGCTIDDDCDDGNECTTEVCAKTKCVVTPVDAGGACTDGICNGTAPEKCVACIDDASGGNKDSGCSNAKPVCDAGDTPTCYQCVKDADCATDNVSCTVETCSNHVCTHVATDSKCPSTDACNPGKCDATTGCTTTPITPTSLVLINASKNNGSFETGSSPSTPKQNPAAGWNEDGPYYLTKNCSSGCIPASNNGATTASAGKVLAWLGGAEDAGESDLNRVISLPAGAVSLHIQADTNFQTASTAASNDDQFQVRLMDAVYEQIGAALYSKSASDAQLGDTHVWTTNGIDVTADETALGGQDVSISFWSSVDTDPDTITDFFMDNVRISVTYCQ